MNSTGRVGNGEDGRHDKICGVDLDMKSTSRHGGAAFNPSKHHLLTYEMNITFEGSLLSTGDPHLSRRNPVPGLLQRTNYHQITARYQGTHLNPRIALKGRAGLGPEEPARSVGDRDAGSSLTVAVR